MTTSEHKTLLEEEINECKELILAVSEEGMSPARAANERFAKTIKVFEERLKSHLQEAEEALDKLNKTLQLQNENMHVSFLDCRAVMRSVDYDLKKAPGALEEYLKQKSRHRI